LCFTKEVRLFSKCGALGFRPFQIKGRRGRGGGRRGGSRVGPALGTTTRSCMVVVVVHATPATKEILTPFCLTKEKDKRQISYMCK